MISIAQWNTWALKPCIASMYMTDINLLLYCIELIFYPLSVNSLHSRFNTDECGKMNPANGKEQQMQNKARPRKMTGVLMSSNINPVINNLKPKQSLFIYNTTLEPPNSARSWRVTWLAEYCFVPSGLTSDDEYIRHFSMEIWIPHGIYKTQ